MTYSSVYRFFKEKSNKYKYQKGESYEKNKKNYFITYDGNP